MNERSRGRVASAILLSTILLSLSGCFTYAEVRRGNPGPDSGKNVNLPEEKGRAPAGDVPDPRGVQPAAPASGASKDLREIYRGAGT